MHVPLAFTLSAGLRLCMLAPEVAAAALLHHLIVTRKRRWQGYWVAAVCIGLRTSFACQALLM